MTDPSPSSDNSPHRLALVRRIVRDPLIRRTVIASLFAAAFVWVAVDAFNVNTEVVWRYFVLSLALVAVMMGGALLVALAVGLLRRLRRGAGEIEEGEDR